MLFKTIKQAIRYFRLWCPFNLNIIICVIIIYLLYPFLETNSYDSNTTLQYLRLLRNYIIFFALIIITLSVIITIIAWLYYIVLKWKNKSVPEFEFYKSNINANNDYYFELKIPKAYRPFLGFVKAKFIYDDHFITNSFAITSVKYKKGISLKNEYLYGKFKLDLPNIKEYKLKGVYIYFEDIFRFISLPTYQTINGYFYKKPTNIETSEILLSPKQTTTSEIRINELRRSEGDYLHFKNYETGDDIRRIIWKLYAKNKNLIVRVPEILEPFASELKVQISFYNSLFNIGVESKYSAPMLDYYKVKIWGIINQLLKQDLKLNLQFEKDLQLICEPDNKDKIEHTITTYNWQDTLPLSNFYNDNKVSLIILSSATPAFEVKNILQISSHNTQFIYVKLSDTFKPNIAAHWLKWIFFSGTNSKSSRIHDSWIFSPIKRRLIKNEKEIEKLLKMFTKI